MEGAQLAVIAHYLERIADALEEANEINRQVSEMVRK